MSSGRTQNPRFRYVVVSITTRCNLSCSGCFRVGRGLTDMPLPLFERVLDTLKMLGCQHLNITGGEPTLHPQWREYIRLARTAGLAPMLSTNATSFDSLSDPILQHLAVLSLPIDAASPATNDRMRCPEHFARVTALVREYLLEEAPFILKVNTIVAAENMTEIPGILDIVNDSRVVWKLFQFSPRGDFSRSGSLSPVSSEQFGDLLARLLESPIRRCRIASLASDSATNYIIVDPEGAVLVPDRQSFKHVGQLLALETIQHLRSFPRADEISPLDEMLGRHVEGMGGDLHP